MISNPKKIFFIFPFLINLVVPFEGIISRASAARGGSALYDNSEMDRDSISNSDIGAKSTTTAWNITQLNGVGHAEETGALQRSNKKLSWSNGGPGPITVNGKVLQ